MSVRELLVWQWSGYVKYHTSRANLLLHIVLVPLFLLGNIGLLVALAQHAWWGVAGSVVLMAVSMAVQGRGHRKEALPTAPFTGPGNAIARILLEQWVTFPRFVLSGQWSHALRQSA